MPRLLDTESSDAPVWIFRQHSPAPVTALAFGSKALLAEDAEDDTDSDNDDVKVHEVSDDGMGAAAMPSDTSGATYIMAGDGDGRVSVTSIALRRSFRVWQAHKKGCSLLGIEQWRSRIITHGRDNAIRIWSLDDQQASPIDSTVKQVPPLLHTLEVNALNFCRFALLPTDTSDTALLAVCHTVDSGYVDLYQLPELRRIHAAIGKAGTITAGAGGFNRAPIVMSMHLHRVDRSGNVLVAGYEDGTIKVWNNQSNGSWSCLFNQKQHRESVLTTSAIFDPTSQILSIFSAGADDRLCFLRFDLTSLSTDAIKLQPTEEYTVATGRQGRSFLSLFAASTAMQAVVGGWDGRARMYTISGASEPPIECTKVLRYHKETVQTLAVTEVAAQPQKHLIALGGKDGRISLWST